MKNKGAEAEENTDDKVSHKIKTYGKFYLHIIIDLVFLILWIFAQFMTEHCIYWIKNTFPGLHLDGIETTVFIVFKIIFAITTLFPVALYTFRDLTIMWYRVKQEIVVNQKATRKKNIDN